MTNIRLAWRELRAATGPMLLSGVGLCLCVTTAGAQSAPRQQFGLNVHPGQKAETLESQLSPIGVSIRTDFHWALLETQKGVLSIPASYSDLDEVITYVSQHGANPIIVLDYGNKLYTGSDGEEPDTASSIAGFAQYATFVVSHFKGRATQFEVWNEWNYNAHSSKKPHVWGDAQAYVNLLRSTYQAIKAVDPNAIVIGGTPGGLDTNWINQFIHAGGLSYLDAFAVHPYVLHRMHATRPARPTVTEPIDKDGSAAASPVLGTPEDSIAWVESIHDRVSANSGHRNIPIYVTENGWPTNSGDLGVPEQVQAAYLQRFLLLAKVRPWIAGVWWYELIDGGSDQANSEQRFGILRQNAQGKPAYESLMQIKGVLLSSQLTQTTTGSGAISVSGSYGNKTFTATWLPTDDFASAIHSQEFAGLLNSGFRPLASGAADPTFGAVPALLQK